MKALTKVDAATGVESEDDRKARRYVKGVARMAELTARRKKLDEEIGRVAKTIATNQLPDGHRSLVEAEQRYHAAVMAKVADTKGAGA